MPYTAGPAGNRGAGLWISEPICRAENICYTLFELVVPHLKLKRKQMSKTTEFKRRHLHGWFDHVRFWFYVRKIYWVKRMSLFEGVLDKIYFESKYSDLLSYNDSEDRKQLEAQHKLPYDKQDPVIISNFEDKIARSKAIKQSYRNNETFVADSERYVEMLELWLQDDWHDEADS